MTSPDSPAQREELEEGEEVEDDEAEAARAPESTASPVHAQDEASPAPMDAPPLPDEAPPLPDEAPPLPDEEPPDDGWEPLLDEKSGQWYFFNRFTQASQWENPRVPEASSVPAASGLGSHDRIGSSTTGPPGTSSPPKRSVAGGYDPKIHGNYDPTADYALEAQASDDEREGTESARLADPNSVYAAAGTFNRFTGKWQSSALTPDNFNDESKSKRQMNAFFDVDAAANSHNGKSLKEERQSKKLSKEEIKAYKEKRRAKKEEKRRAWLRD
jgi:hypothetical protein